MGTPLTTRGTGDLIYDYALSSAYRSPWIYDPSGALLREPDVWEIVRNQTDMLAEIQRRNNSIVRPWRVAPNYHASYNTKDKATLDASKQLAAICHEGLSHCDQLDEARTLLSETFFLGRKYGVIYWEPVYTSLDGTPEMTWYLPYKIKDLDRRRVHWVPDWTWVKPDGSRELVKAGTEITYQDGTTVSQMQYPKGGYLQKSSIHLEMFNTDNYRWERISDEQRRNLIEHIYYDSEDRIGMGRGVLEAAYFTHYFLMGTFQKIVEGIDRYANGVLVMKLDSLRNASTDRTNTDLLNAAKALMNTYRSQHYVALQDGDDLEIKEATGRGFAVSMEFIQHLIASFARLCNGSARPAGHSVDGSGARAQASEEANTSEAFYQNDRNSLDHVMTRDFLGSFLYHNQQNFLQLGLEKAKRPKFTSEQIRRQDPDKAIMVMGQVLQAGQSILKSEFYDRVELTPPHEDDDVVEGMMASPTDSFGNPMQSGFGGAKRQESGENGGDREKGEADKAR